MGLVMLLMQEIQDHRMDYGLKNVACILVRVSMWIYALYYVYMIRAYSAESHLKPTILEALNLKAARWHESLCSFR